MRVLTLGTFDLLHDGHRWFFDYCERFGELRIGVNADDFVEKFKGQRPFMSQNERLDTCEIYAPVFLHDPSLQSTQDYIFTEMPDILIVGSDWHEKGYLAQLGMEQIWFDQHKIGVLYAPIPYKYSSRQIRKELYG